ncbi:hypothetical protein Q2T40_05255 [Winogradskyella maritima]|nr:hypothetical protein [Winogradskyella maritima]
MAAGNKDVDIFKFFLAAGVNVNQRMKWEILRF